LIEKRGRVDGSIQKIERYLDKHRRQFEKYQALTNELSLLRETLASIDTALRLHKLQVDPQNIPTIHGKNHVTDLPRGALTQLICERIEMGKGCPVSSEQIVDFILERRQATGERPIVRTFLSQQVTRRLNGLYWAKRLVRHHQQQTNHCGWWTLSSHTTQDTQTADDDLAHSL
jgi:hypothetical protein